MSADINNSSNAQAYWQSPPPTPQDSSTARDRVEEGVPRYNTQQPQRPDRAQVYVGTKDHIVAGLLALFFGALGVHKFYLGYNTAGFIMLGVTILGSIITFGVAGAVMGLIGFIEGVLYLIKSQADFDYIYVQNYKEWF